MILLEKHNPLWPKYFAKEAEKLKEIFKKELVAIHHVGSTAVPGLIAKPIIDIIPVVRNILKVDALIPAMQTLGYEAKGEFGIPFRRFFTRQESAIGFNTHVYEKNNPEILRLTLFRDYLKKHPLSKKHYAELKIKLAQKYASDRKAYCDAKSEFINEIDAKSGYEGFRIVQISTEEERQAYHQIRKAELFDVASIEYDPNHPSLRLESHVHFVFRKETIIIGIAEIEFLEPQKAVLRSLAIEASLQNEGYGTQLLKMLQKWLQQRGCHTLLLHTTKKAISFYKRLGYKQIPSWEKNPLPINFRIDIIDMEKKLSTP